MKRMLKSLFALLVTCIIAGCGGGDDAPAAPANGAGIYVGQAEHGNDGLPASETLVVLADGTAWAFYGNGLVSPIVQAFTRAPGVSAGGSYHSTSSAADAPHYYGAYKGSDDATTLTATYVPGQSITGTDVIASTGGGGGRFTAVYTPGSANVPSLGLLAGAYAAPANGSIVVSPSGAINIQYSAACPYQGTVTPRAADNAFDVDILNCSGNRFVGLLYFDADRQQVILASVWQKTPFFLTASAIGVPLGGAACDAFKSQPAAQQAYLAGRKELDRNGNGIACDGLPITG